MAIKLIMLYPSAKSKRNTMHMARMNPKMQEIKKRCGNDQERYAMEIQKLYQSEHVNPLGGCLWSFLPLPILIALYGIIRRPVLNFMLINMARPEALEKVEALKQALINIGYEFPQSLSLIHISSKLRVRYVLEKNFFLLPFFLFPHRGGQEKNRSPCSVPALRSTLRFVRSEPVSPASAQKAASDRQQRGSRAPVFSGGRI